MDPAASIPAKPLSSFTPQSDSAKYIRTYAKDFAAVSGQTADMGTPLQPARPPAPEEAIVTEGGVTLPDYDPSPVNRGDAASPKEFDQEVVDLQQSDSNDIFAGAAQKTPAVQPASASSWFTPHAAISPAPIVEPAPINETEPAPEPVSNFVPQPISAPVETDDDREAILARLRAKVAAERAVNATAPVISESPLRTAAPDFTSTPEPVLPIPQPFKALAPVTPPAFQPSSDLHTYSSDFADRIDSASGTTFSVLAAQSDAGQTPRSTQPRKRTIVPLLAGGGMLVIGIAAILGAYLFTRNGGVPTVAGIPSLIQSDENVEVKGSGLALMQAIADVAGGGSVQGNVIVTYVTLATTTGSGIPQSGGALIRQMSLPAPDILLRNIHDTSTVGIVRASTEARPFMILKVNSYERTFAGMLAWEPTMASDLAAFYPAYAAAQTNSSSTAAVSSFNSNTFNDAVVANYDVRVLRDSSGKSILLYGYRGKDILIIARDEAAFTALVSRLSAAGK